VRESPAKSRGIWKVAAAAAGVGLIATAGTWWARSGSDAVESLGAEDTGLAAPYYATWDAIGCSNYASIEIYRTTGVSKMACEDLCTANAACTSYNYQADACQPGYEVPGACILFGGTCDSERNGCWSLTYKWAAATTSS